MQKDRLAELYKAAGYKYLATFAREAGIDPGTANKHVQRDSIPADAAAQYIEAAKDTGATIDWLLTGKGTAPGTVSKRATSTESPREVRGNITTDENGPIAVFRSSAWGGGRSGGVLIYKNEKQGEVERNERLRYAKRAYAFELSEDFGDAYQVRDTLVLDPDSSPAPGDECFFAQSVEHPLQHGLLRRFIRRQGDDWIVRAYGEERESKLPRSEYPIAWRVRQRIMRS